MGILSFLSPSPSKNGKSKGVKKVENGKNGNVRHDTEEPTLDIRPPTPLPLAGDIDPMNTAVVAPQSAPETIDTSASATSQPSTGPLGGHATEAASRPSPAAAVASEAPQEPSHANHPIPEAAERKDDTDVGASSVSQSVNVTQDKNTTVASPSGASLSTSPVKQDDHGHKSADVVTTPSKKDIVLPNPAVLYEEVANGHPSASFIPAPRSIALNRSTSSKAEAAPSPKKTSIAEGAAASPTTPTSPKAKRFSLQSLTSIVRRPSQQSKATESKPAERHSVEVKATATKVAESVPTVKKRSATHDSAHGHLSRESTGLPAKRVNAAAALARRITQRNVSTSDKRAMQEALVVRRLIVGPAAVTLVGKPRTPAAVVTSAEMQSVKGALLEPRKANALIGKLRALPGQPDAAPDGTDAAAAPHGPIRAVCLPFTEEQAHQEAFHKLATKHHQRPPSPAVAALEHALAASPPSSSHPVARTSSRSSNSSHSSIFEALPSVLSASASALADTFDGLSLVNLVTAPGFGIGQPGDGKGLLSGAVPTAETVINGITQITPQLMNLGYATGREILPDHTGVYPPTDRLSVLTYWWGLEVVLPPPTLVYLSHAPSVAHAVINFLTAMSVANNGVAEILPFIRYISQYIDFEWNTIKQVDEGKGVVCAATWIMPAAMVPRAWDFADPPVLTTPVQPPAPAPASPTEGDVVHPPLAFPAALAAEAKADQLTPVSHAETLSHPTES